MTAIVRTSIFLLLINAGVLSAQTFSGSTGNISDDGTINNFTATVSGLTQPVTSSYGCIQVCLNITHTYNSDLNVELVSPDGVVVTLFSGIGGDGDNFTNLCLNQSATQSVVTGNPPYSGLFRPQQSLGNVNNGANGNGAWTLRILDTYAFADTGTVNSWTISFGPDAPEPFVFSSSNLPIVIINTGGVPIPDDPKVDATIGIISNGAGNLNYVTDFPNDYNGFAGIEVRGNFSQILPQKPYKFETRDAEGAELNASLLGMPAEHDWCLLSTYNDKVFMRNAFAYSLFGQMGNYAARTRYCEVVLNGDYQGIYLLTESIKRDDERVDIAKLDPDENSGIDLTGGYIIKSDYWTSEDSWQLQYHPLDQPERDVWLVYEYPKPENISPTQQQYIQNYINDLETALYGPDFANPTTGYAKYLDAESFIDYFIVNELARNIDGFRKSFFFHKDKDGNNGEVSPLKAGPVWDFDWAFKNIWSCSMFEATDGSGWAYQINDCNPDVASPAWHIRLLQDTAFQNKLRCRWEEYRGSFMSDQAINDYIDQMAATLGVPQSRHFERWGNLGINTGTPEVSQDPPTFEGQIAAFRDWIMLRLEWLDANLPGTAVGCALAVEEGDKEIFRVYPNPADKELLFEGLPADVPYTAELYNVSGQLILKSVVANARIDVSDVATGFYICRITSSAAIVTTAKVIICH
ncbi:MAG TPA: CotH kinase family protein [Flavobacterium sp.]|jgi:subtilisin-like proprotein convertase family protein